MPPASLSLPLVTLLFVAGLGLTGLFLLRTGWRGRRLDDHPVCRRCRFDLTGIPRGDDGEPPKCPECGWRREPRIGNRRRSGVRITCGIVLLGLALVGSGVVAWSRADAAGLAAVKPVWLLRIEARTGESDAAAVALRELTDRLLTGELSADQGEQLIVEALTHGPAGNPAVYHASIGSSWDRLAAELMRAGHGSDDQRVALAKSWLDLSVRVRPRVEQGAVLPMELSGGTYGPPTDVGLWRTPQQATVSINGHTHPIGYSRSGPMQGGRGFGPSSRAKTMALEPGRGLPMDLALGTHTVRVERPVEITDGPSGAVLAAWIHVEELPCEFVETGEDRIELIQDDASVSLFRKRLSIPGGRLSGESVGFSSGLMRAASIEIEAPPVPYAFSVFLRKDGLIWEYGRIVGHAQNDGITHQLPRHIPDELRGGDRVEVLLVPAPELARDTVEIDRVLGETLVIPDIVIVR